MSNNLYDIKKGDKTSLPDFIDTKFREQRTNFSEMYRSWMLNLAWLRGHQNVDYSTNKRSFVRPKTEAWRIRLVSNLMLPIVRKNIAKIAHIHPQWDVLPATSDEEDIQIASTATDILKDIWQKQNMSQKLVRLLFWQGACGNEFLKVGWDPDLGDEFSVAAEDIEKETLARFLEFAGIEGPEPEQVQINTGDIYIDLVSPFNMTVDDVDVFDDAMWCTETQLRSPDWVADKFGNKFKDLEEAPESDIFVYPFLKSDERNMPKRGVLVHDFFAKPTRKFKNGLHAIIAAGKIVDKGDHPFSHKELPFAHFLEIYDPASMWGTSTAEQIRPNQARYNRVQSAILEQINMMGKLQWLNPIGSGVRNFTNQPGSVINYNVGRKPEQTDLKPLPAYIERFLDRTRLDIQDTSSSHDVSEAKAEPGIRSGKAVLALQDADDSVLGPVLLWFDTALARIGRLTLQTLNQFVSEERVIQVHGEFNELEALTYTGAMLNGENQGNYWNVRTKTTGRQSLSRSGRMQLVETLVSLQLINPVTQREEMLRMLDTADTMSMFDQTAMDKARQWREIQQMIETNEPAQVNEGQKHDVHIEQIRKFISGSKWDKLEGEQKQLILQHMDEHLLTAAIEGAKRIAFQQEALKRANVQLPQQTQPGRGGQQPRPSPTGGQAGGNQAGGNQTGTRQAGGIARPSTV